MATLSRAGKNKSLLPLLQAIVGLHINLFASDISEMSSDKNLFVRCLLPFHLKAFSLAECNCDFNHYEMIFGIKFGSREWLE